MDSVPRAPIVAEQRQVFVRPGQSARCWPHGTAAVPTHRGKVPIRRQPNWGQTRSPHTDVVQML